MPTLFFPAGMGERALHGCGSTKSLTETRHRYPWIQKTQELQMFSRVRPMAPT